MTRCFNPRAPRGARQVGFSLGGAQGSFNPRAPRGARPEISVGNIYSQGFQPTRPARGATTPSGDRRGRGIPFQPTRPARGATVARRGDLACKFVSTHAPREGRDNVNGLITIYNELFQPTRPARGATSTTSSAMRPHGSFNPRAPRGARREPLAIQPGRSCFNPRAPRGARLSLHA